MRWTQRRPRTGPGASGRGHPLRTCDRAEDNTITIRWVPSHRGVEGNEQADQRAVEAATLPLPRAAVRRRSLEYLRRRATEQAIQTWRDDTRRRAGGRRSFVLPSADSRPAIRPAPRRVPKGVAARFFQLLNGHAMIPPFLRDKWGRIDTTGAGGAAREGRVESISLKSALRGPERYKS